MQGIKIGANTPHLHTNTAFHPYTHLLSPTHSRSSPAQLRAHTLTHTTQSLSLTLSFTPLLPSALASPSSICFPQNCLRSSLHTYGDALKNDKNYTKIYLINNHGSLGPLKYQRDLLNSGGSNPVGKELVELFNVNVTSVIVLNSLFLSWYSKGTSWLLLSTKMSFLKNMYKSFSL